MEKADSEEHVLKENKNENIFHRHIFSHTLKKEYA